MRKVVILLWCAAVIAPQVVSMQPAGAAFYGGNGPIVYARGCCGEGTVYTINTDGTSKLALSNPAKEELPLSVAWSPSGSVIAFDAGRTRHGNYKSHEIRVMDSDGSNKAWLTRDRRGDWDPAWSPDGTKIVWSRETASGTTDLFIMNSDGTGRIRVTFTPKNEYEAVWSPDGSSIVFNRLNRSWTTSDLFSVALDGSGEVRLTDTVDQEWSPDWSPGGDYVAYSRNGDIFKLTIPGMVESTMIATPAWEGMPVISPSGAMMAWVRGTEVGPPEEYLSEMMVGNTMGGGAAVLDSCTLNCGITDLDWQAT